MKRKMRTEGDVRQVFDRYPDVARLYNELSRIDGITVQLDGNGECVFKVYLTGMTGPFESFLWVYKSIEKSQVGWSGQLPELREVCREIWSGAVLSPSNVHGSQLQRGVEIDLIVRIAKRYANVARRTRPRTA